MKIIDEEEEQEGMEIIGEESTNIIEVTDPAGESFILFYIFYSLLYIQILKQTLINFKGLLRSLVGFCINNLMLFLISFKGAFPLVMPLEMFTTGVMSGWLILLPWCREDQYSCTFPIRTPLRL